VILNCQALKTHISTHLKLLLVEVETEVFSNQLNEKLVSLAAFRVSLVKRALELVDSELELKITLVQMLVRLGGSFLSVFELILLAILVFFHDELMLLSSELERLGSGPPKCILV